MAVKSKSCWEHFGHAHTHELLCTSLSCISSCTGSTCNSTVIVVEDAVVDVATSFELTELL